MFLWVRNRKPPGSQKSDIIISDCYSIGQTCNYEELKLHLQQTQQSSMTYCTFSLLSTEIWANYHNFPKNWWEFKLLMIALRHQLQPLHTISLFSQFNIIPLHRLLHFERSIWCISGPTIPKVKEKVGTESESHDKESYKTWNQNKWQNESLSSSC